MSRLLLNINLLCLLFVSFHSQASAVTEEKKQEHNQLNHLCLNLMPCPKQIMQSVGSFTLSSAPRLFISGMSDNKKNFVLQHFSKQLNNVTHYDFHGFVLTNDIKLADISLIISSSAKSTKENDLPKLGDDESYLLTITEQGTKINAESYFGALHGLTSLIQIIAMPEYVARATVHANTQIKKRSAMQLGNQPQNQLSLPLLRIYDQPRFKWRGLLIDSVRHFIPLAAIKRQLDGMAAAKLNVFHWHLTDDQGWRIETKTYPKLHELASDGLYYTQAQIKDVVSYASNLGIRVVPEFDLPGHASAIAVAYPELMAKQKRYTMERQWGVFEPLLDVTNPDVYIFIDTLVGELTRLFPDEYLHIGGDEVNPKQWDNNDKIKQLMAKHALKNGHDVHSFFNAKLQNILTKHQRKMMGWDEIFHNDLSKSIVVQSWRGLQSLNIIAGSGYQALLSAGYYIDQPQATSYHYRNDPLANVASPNENSAQERRLNRKDEQWQTWSFEMPRLKGSAVKGALTLITQQNSNTVNGYLKLNDHYHQTVYMHSTAAELSEGKAAFSMDSWMGPLEFEVTVPKKGRLSGFAFVGNSYYALAGSSLVSEKVASIPMQPKIAMAQAKNILGGEATLWSEMVTERNIDLRMWPRLFAIAERFWSPQSLNDSDYMYQRLIAVNDYAADVVGLRHQQQQIAGYSHLVSQSTERKKQLDTLLTFSQMLAPAHYYTRHHIKYQQNLYHQNASLDNFVDFLPVESFALVKMKKDVTRFVQGDKSGLANIKSRYIAWQKNAKDMSLLIPQVAELKALSSIVDDIDILNKLAIILIERCMNNDLYNKEEALVLDKKLIVLQQETREIVIAAVPLTRELLSRCQISR